MFNVPMKYNKNNRASVASLWDDFDTMHRELDRLFSLSFPQLLPTQYSSEALNWTPAIDVVDAEKELIIKADLPGLAKSDIELKVDHNWLHITGEKKREETHKDKGYIRSERFFGRFSRTIQLPDTVDTKAIKASFTDGVLSVTMPKTAKVDSSTKIAIDGV